LPPEKSAFDWEESWGRGVQIYREASTAHLTALAMGKEAHRVGRELIGSKTKGESPVSGDWI
jgi:hypothetical protein